MKLPNLENIFSGIVKPFANGAVKIGEKYIDSKEKLEQYKADIAIVELETNQRMTEFVYKDMADARAMYNKDNSLQKTFAIAILVKNIILVIILFLGIAHFMKMPEYVIALISMILTSSDNSVKQVCGFIFGSSVGSQEKTASMIETIKNNNQKNEL